MPGMRTRAYLLAASFAFFSPVVPASVVQFQIATFAPTGNAADDTPLPTSTAPFSSLTFTDVAPGVVQLVVRSDLESSTDFISQTAFNLDPALSAANLLFTFGGQTGSFTLPTIGAGTNNQTLSGNVGISGFDVRFDFANGTTLTRFDGFETLTYNITCAACAGGLDALDFNFATSAGFFAGDKTGFQGTPVDSNGARFVDSTAANNVIAAIPEPAPLGLLTFGLLGFGLVAFRKRES
jgi:hypothetical protein